MQKISFIIFLKRSFQRGKRKHFFVKERRKDFFIFVKTSFLDLKRRKRYIYFFFRKKIFKGKKTFFV